MARSFASVSDQAETTAFGAMPVPGSISIWLNPSWASGDSTTRGIWSGGGGNATSDCPSFQRFGNNSVFIGFANNGDTRLTFADTGLFTSGTWSNWVYTYSSSGQVCYKDGVSKASGGAFTITNTGTGWDFGNMANYVGVHTSGVTVADCAIWNVVLTASEVAALASGVRPYLVRPSAIVGYWPIDGLASPEPDFSGNKNNATITGTSAANGPPVTIFTPKARTSPLSAAAAVTEFRKSILGTRIGSRQAA